MGKLNIWKWRSTKIILSLALLLSIICLIQMLRPGREYLYEGGMCFTEGLAVSGQPVYEGISLPAGVYRVALEYSTSEDLRSLCQVKDGTVFPGGLLTNGESLYSGLTETRFQMWLFERADALQVSINYDGVGRLETGRLRIYDTGQLWGIYLTVVLTVTLLLLAVQLLYAYDKEYGIARENKAVMLGLTVIVVLASVPYLVGGVPTGGDLGYHMHRIEGVRDGILAGYFPVRLEPEWVHGHGYASGIFYCSTLLLFPAFLRIIGFPVTFAYNCYVIGLNIATALIAYYSLSRIFRDKYIGLAGSALYTLSIFRFYRLLAGTVGEYSAITFLPLLVYGFWRVFTQDRQDKKYRTCWIPLAFGYAGLFQTHVLSCEITAFLTVVLCLVMIKRVLRRETFWELCKGAAAALIMSAWFLVPFLDYYVREDLHIKHVWARTIQERGLYPAQLLFHWWRGGGNALLGESGMTNSQAMGVGFVLMLGLFFFVILWFGGRLAHREDPVWKLGQLSVILGGLLLIMSQDFFPWDTIQKINRLTASLVSSLQFPYRFLGWSSTFLVILCCCCLYYFKGNGNRLQWRAGILCVAVGIATSGMYYAEHSARDVQYINLYNVEGMGFGYISGAEYLVEGTTQDSLLYHAPVASDNVQITDYEKGALKAEFFCSNVSGQEGYVELPLLHYYGYRAYGENGELTACKGDNNLVRVVIPAGCSTRVTVRFVSPWYWRVAEGVSWLGTVWILFVCIRYQKKKMEHAERGRHEGIPAKA